MATLRSLIEMNPGRIDIYGSIEEWLMAFDFSTMPKEFLSEKVLDMNISCIIADPDSETINVYLDDNDFWIDKYAKEEETDNDRN